MQLYTLKGFDNRIGSESMNMLLAKFFTSTLLLLNRLQCFSNI